MANSDNALGRVLELTGRAELNDALAWLGEDRPMAGEVNWSELLQAVVAVAPTSELGDRAVRRVVREATRSEVDTARVIFDSENLARPEEFNDALNELLSKSADGTLAGLSARAILRAYHANSRAIETICLVAGVPYNEAVNLFGRSNGSWDLESIQALYDYLDALVSDRIKSPIPNSVPSKAVEMVFGQQNGWELADQLRVDGVPYELLLTQRAVGGAWLAHRNTTSSFPNMAAAELVSTSLRDIGIDFRRSSVVGGVSRPTDLQQLSGISNKRVGIVVLSDDVPKFAIAFSSARDGGTARANGDGLLTIPPAALPLALVLTGLGWSERTETDRLARRFDGLLFTERSIDELVDRVNRSLS